MKCRMPFSSCASAGRSASLTAIRARCATLRASSSVIAMGGSFRLRRVLPGRPGRGKHPRRRNFTPAARLGRMRRRKQRSLPMKLTWLGHSGFRLEIEQAVILIDPWLSGNPMFPEDSRDEAIRDATHVLLTHGYGD